MTHVDLLNILWLLFMLPGVFGSMADSSPELATVLILLFVFLLLLMLLIFSWHKLNLDTDDKYHPKRLWYGGDDEDGGGAVARLADAVSGRWQALRNRVMGDSSVVLDQPEEVMEQEPRESLEDGDMESVGEEDAQRDVDGESEEDEMDSEDDFSSMEGFEPGQGRALKAVDRPTEKRAADETAAGTSEALLPNLPAEMKVACDPAVGTSEALLSNLHPFSGSVTWEDEVPEGGVSVRVTAL